MIRFEKSLGEGITEIKRPTEFSFRNYSIYNLEPELGFLVSTLKIRNFPLLKKEKGKKERKKKKERSEMKSKMLLASIIHDSSTIICTDLRRSFPLRLERLIYFTKMCI